MNEKSFFESFCSFPFQTGKRAKLNLIDFFRELICTGQTQLRRQKKIKKTLRVRLFSRIFVIKGIKI